MNLETQIGKIVEANGAFLYDIEIVTEFDETIFRVLVTKEGGVDLDLCADISHELSPFLDVHPPMSQKYRLEVSSPGIERKLTKPVHFQNAIGEKVKLKIKGGDKIKGIISRSKAVTRSKGSSKVPIMMVSLWKQHRVMKALNMEY